MEIGGMRREEWRGYRNVRDKVYDERRCRQQSPRGEAAKSGGFHHLYRSAGLVQETFAPKHDAPLEVPRRIWFDSDSVPGVHFCGIYDGMAERDGSAR